MSRNAHAHLRGHRKRTGFSQEQLSYLMGSNNGEGVKISHYERMFREPNLKAAFALQIIYGVAPHELFPGIFAKVEQRITSRAKGLLAELENKPCSPDIWHQREILRMLLVKPNIRNFIRYELPKFN